MEASKTEIIARALYARKKDNTQEKFLAKTFDMLSEPICYADLLKLVQKRAHSLFPHSMWEMDFETISKIVEATALANLEKANTWLSNLSDLFDQDADYFKCGFG